MSDTGGAGSEDDHARRRPVSDYIPIILVGNIDIMASSSHARAMRTYQRVRRYFEYLLLVARARRRQLAR